MSWSKLFKNPWVFWIGIVVLYLIVHLPHLTVLPIFADEAIYIRWGQLILTDWKQYLFFPLNDGKTPLFIWMLVPFLKTIADPLLAGRVVAVIGGLFQLVITIQILKTLRVNKVGQLVAALLVIFAPFWFFHHRMVLMDGWLTVWLSLATLAVLKVTQSGQRAKHEAIWLGVGVLSVWAGMMTKVPFVLSVPALLLLPFRHRSHSVEARRNWIHVAIIIVGGGILFSVVSLLPVFPQLLSRGGDFLLPIRDVLIGRWQETVPSIPTYLGYFVSYMGWGACLLAILSLVVPGKRRIGLILAASFIVFSAPIWVLGRVVFPRYLFPALLYLTLMSGLGAGSLWQWSVAPVHTNRRRFAIRLLIVLLSLQMILTSLQFIVPSWYRPNEIPFVPSDQTQYLTTWSSGHGLAQTYQLLEQLNATQTNGTIRVATEGAFGSLPDGLLLYNFRQPLSHVWIEGIGYPVDSIPSAFYEKIQPNDRVLLVVNSDRLKWELDQNELLKQYCRPFGGPCLQIWDITSSYPQFEKH